MEQLFSQDFKYIWVVMLTLALWFPVRRLLWVLSVRRAIGKGGEANVDEAEKERLKRRAGFTAALICFLFSLGYISVLFKP